MIIGQFNNLEDRNDVGEIWENFIVAERLKRNAYKNNYYNFYFWRDYEQKEIDWIEEGDGKIFGYEIKWKKGQFTPPKNFSELYPLAEVKIINRDDYLDFIVDQ
jgi:predicted AAA+ superfamily ATPase